MGLSDWNWRLPADMQDVPWDCSACSTAWAMRTVGRDVTEADVVAGLGPDRISPTYGLLDASGSGLVEYLAEQGIGASNNPDCTWQQLLDTGGEQPVVMGGRAWGHWVAMRIPSGLVVSTRQEAIALMNPSPGYRGVFQVLEEEDFDVLGPFSAVWFTNW